MSRLPIIILAGGKATRMNQPVPKPLLSLNGKPLLVWQLEALTTLASEVRIVIPSSPMRAQMFREAIAKHSFSFPISFVPQNPSDYGTGAALAGVPLLPHSFIVLLGDCYYDPKDLAKLLITKNSVLVKYPNPNSSGGIVLNKDRSLNYISETGPRRQYANTGALHINSNIIQMPCRDSDTGEDKLTIRLNAYAQKHTITLIRTRRWFHLSTSREYSDVIGGMSAAPKTCVNLWHTQNGRLMLMQRTDEPWTASPGMYQLLGGHVRADESPKAALCREIQEELGLAVQLDDLTPILVKKYPHKTEHVYRFVQRKRIVASMLREGQRLVFVPPKVAIQKTLVHSDYQLLQSLLRMAGLPAKRRSARFGLPISALAAEVPT